MSNNKLSLRHPNNRFRKKILIFSSTIEKFNLDQIYDWYVINYPKEAPTRNKLSAYLGKLEFLEKLGYVKYAGKSNMEYKLRDDYALDRKIQTE